MLSRPGRLFTIATACAVLALATACPGAQAAEASPSGVVERVNGALIDIMREAESLGFEGRFERLAPVLVSSFDFPSMASISVGRHWRTLDEAQRDRLIEAFGRMSIATFAARFDGYSGERFQIAGEEKAPRAAVIVRNRLIKANGEAVPIDYLLRRDKGSDGWRVVDVFLDAKFSELAIKRSEYSSVIANEGFDALLRDLRDKIAQFAAEG